MCKFCKGEELLHIPELDKPVIKGNEVNIDYDAYSTDSSFTDTWVINYCPMCGTKLVPIKSKTLTNG